MLNPISEIIDDKENGARPVIVQFQNSEVQEGEEVKLRTGIYKKSKNTLVVAAATDDILYTGEINREKEKNDPYKRFLLISNEKTGKVRLVAVDVAVLAPQLKKKQIDPLDNTLSAGGNSVNKLNKQFGSKRIKRITEQRERLKMNIEDIKEQLEKTVANVQMDETESFSLLKPNENESAYRPPLNREASHREDVYVLDDVVPEYVLDSLEEEAKSVLSSDIDTLNLSPFIAPHIIKIQGSELSNRLHKCKLFLYVNYLITYILKPVKNITKRFVLCESSKEVNDHILNNFSVNSSTGRTRPLSMKDKAICSILVLSMIALDYELDIEALSKSIKVGVKKLQEMARVLAFSTHGKNKNIMVLKLPLPPAVSVSPRKRKR